MWHYPKQMDKKKILVTGAAGYIGSKLIRKLMEHADEFQTVVGIDIRDAGSYDLPNFHFVACDILSETPEKLIAEHKIDVIVHLASIVKAPKGMSRERMYEIDVEGTRKLLESAVKHGVQQFIVTTSGASYGYHADNPEFLKESDPIRGNEEFAYSHHKRLIEEMLQEYHKKHPQLRQLILRPGTILGKGVSNQITDIFEKKFILGIKGTATPFVFIWDEDVVNIIYTAIKEEKEGVFNLAGDGVLTLEEIAHRLNKPYVQIPEKVLKNILSVLKKFGLTQYGPEQTGFLQYRPVLDNTKLKQKFAYQPAYTSEEVFEYYLENKRK